MTFNAETYIFLKELSENNQKVWFDQNRDRYNAHWLEPAKTFVEEWTDFMGGLKPPHKAEPRVNGSIRRINRDIRFSKDKTPYDPKIHLVFWCGEHPNKSAAIHVVIKHDRLSLGTGQWSMTPEELKIYRMKVLSDEAGSQLENLSGELSSLGLGLTAETLKKIPADLPPDSVRGEFLRRKGLVLTTGDSPLPLSLLENRPSLEEYFRAMAQINLWLNEQY